jgi:hypothetical protein
MDEGFLCKSLMFADYDQALFLSVSASGCLVLSEIWSCLAGARNNDFFYFVALLTIAYNL